jgi:cell division septation protein DedD
MKCDKVAIIGALAPLKVVIAQIEALAEESGEGGHLNEDQQERAAALVEDFAVEGGKASSKLAFVLIKDEGEQIAEVIESGAKGVIGEVEGLVDSAVNRVKSALGGEAQNMTPAPDVTSTSTATVEAQTPASPEIAPASASTDSSAASTNAPEAAPANAPADPVESQPQS